MGVWGSRDRAEAPSDSGKGACSPDAHWRPAGFWVCLSFGEDPLGRMFLALRSFPLLENHCWTRTRERGGLLRSQTGAGSPRSWLKPRPEPHNCEERPPPLPDLGEIRVLLTPNRFQTTHMPLTLPRGRVSHRSRIRIRILGVRLGKERPPDGRRGLRPCSQGNPSEEEIRVLTPLSESCPPFLGTELCYGITQGFSPEMPPQPPNPTGVEPNFSWGGTNNPPPQASSCRCDIRATVSP